MSEERKPTEDLKEGLSLLFRAARGAAKRIDVNKIDRGLDRAVTQVSRVVNTVGRVVEEEVGRIAAHPPWEKSTPARTEPEATPSTCTGPGATPAASSCAESKPGTESAKTEPTGGTPKD